jgi:hypothetical protein
VPFEVNPSAWPSPATCSAYQHPSARHGHRRVLPLYAPIHVAEQAALLDQPSGGRFDLGVAKRSP